MGRVYKAPEPPEKKKGKWAQPKPAAGQDATQWPLSVRLLSLGQRNDLIYLSTNLDHHAHAHSCHSKAFTLLGVME